MNDWVYYDKPKFNQLIGKMVVAYRESMPDKDTRTVNLEFLVQGDIREIEINGELSFEEKCE